MFLSENSYNSRLISILLAQTSNSRWSKLNLESGLDKSIHMPEGAKFNNVSVILYPGHVEALAQISKLKSLKRTLQDIEPHSNLSLQKQQTD